jgi:hypothetical protein
MVDPDARDVAETLCLRREFVGRQMHEWTRGPGRALLEALVREGSLEVV